MRDIIILLIIMIFLIFISYFFGKKNCENENIIVQQEIEIKAQQIINTETKKVNERRTKALIATPDDNLVWLKENDCEDCR
jgi:hypothetical protein